MPRAIIACLFESIRPDGSLSVDTPAALLRAITEGIQEKAWDCDLEATQKHYQKEFSRQFRKAHQHSPRILGGA